MIIKTEQNIILLYFLSLIATGTLLLKLPGSWSGQNNLELVDAFFTSASAVCVTGLITVDTARFSGFGQLVIAALIQLGGLGLISFSSFYLVLRSKGPSIKGGKIIQEYFLDSIEYEPLDIVKQIIMMTVTVELIGAVFLYQVFKYENIDNPVFTSVFHSISAFCNAGFSTFPNSLENYSGNFIINITVMILIISGGIGFVVFRDILKTLLRVNRKKHLTVHSKIVLLTSLLLILTGAFLLFFIENANYFAERNLREKILISFFHSVTSRTAGFNTVPVNDLNIASQLTIIPLMFIGGSPGSIAGGIKVTTFFIIILILVRDMDDRKNITIFKRNIPAGTIFKALIFTLKAFSLLVLGIFLLTISEHFFNPRHLTLIEIIFECFSAFGTVGLSLGITQYLSVNGKLIIIFIMLCGRFGLLIIAMNIFQKNRKLKIDYPEEEVLIG